MKNRIFTDLKSTRVSDSGSIRDRGFTLIELLMAMAIAAIVMVAIYSVYAGLTRSYTTQNVAADVQQAARATIDIMAGDIMMAGLIDPFKDYSKSKVPLISTAGSGEITFSADRNKDGDPYDEYEDLTYRLDGTELKLIDNNSGIEDTLIDNVIQFEFRYFRENPADTPTNNDLINGKDLITGHGLEDPSKPGYLKEENQSM